jgi:hypothetical protein
MRYEILGAVKMSILFFWVVMRYGIVGRDQRFGGKYFHHPHYTIRSSTVHHIFCFDFTFLLSNQEVKFVL